jgi:hypothetical protein
MRKKPDVYPGTDEVIIRCRTVELVQRSASLFLRHYGKTQTIEVPITDTTLERWALRQLREGVFS